MKTVEGSIQALTRAVLNEANAEADRILADAQQKADALRQHAREQANAERTAILEQAHQEADRMHSQAIAAAQLQARTTRLESRERLLNHVFEEARKQLPTIQQWTDYNQIVSQLLREALAHLGSDAVQVRADERTRAVLTDEMLDALSKELKVHIEHGEPLTQGTGLIVQTPDRHRQYDNTLETRLDRLQIALRAQVLRILMGDTV